MLAEATVATMLEQVTQPDFIYLHNWGPGDLVVWDNFLSLHSITPYDDYKAAGQRRVRAKWFTQIVPRCLSFSRICTASASAIRSCTGSRSQDHIILD